MLRTLFISFLIILIVPAAHATLHINEIYPYPPSTGDGMEYVELYNDSDAMPSADYILEDDVGNKLSFLDTIIATSSYTIAQSKNVLNNSGDIVKLKTKSGSLIDTITYPSISESMSYSKCLVSDTWSTGTSSKNALNAVCTSPTVTLTPEIEHTPINTSDIIISESVANPEKDMKEWVELYNTSSNDYYLKDWYIDDVDSGGASPYQFSLMMPAHGYSVVELNRDMLNNTTDEVRLLTNNHILVDRMSYNETRTQHSLGIAGTLRDSFCFQIPSRTHQNNECIHETTQITPYQAQVLSPTETPSPDQTNLDDDYEHRSYSDYTANDATPESTITPQVLGSTDNKPLMEKDNPSKLPMIIGLTIIIIVTGIVLYMRVRSELQSTE